MERKENGSFYEFDEIDSEPMQEFSMSDATSSTSGSPLYIILYYYLHAMLCHAIHPSTTTALTHSYPPKLCSRSRSARCRRFAPRASTPPVVNCLAPVQRLAVNGIGRLGRRFALRNGMALMALFPRSTAGMPMARARAQRSQARRFAPGHAGR